MDLHPVPAYRAIACVRGVAAQPGPMLIRCFYISQMAEGIADVDVRVILGVAQMINRRLDLTGMLVQGGGHFAQVLEGRSQAVSTLMTRTRRDARHRDVRTLLEEPTRTRRFASWAMGLVRRDDMRQVLDDSHRRGCPGELAARRLMQALTDRLP